MLLITFECFYFLISVFPVWVTQRAGLHKH